MIVKFDFVVVDNVVADVVSHLIVVDNVIADVVANLTAVDNVVADVLLILMLLLMLTDDHCADHVVAVTHC